MSLTATERDAQIMEMRMRWGVSLIMQQWSNGPSYYVRDGCSLVWRTPEAAWDAAIFCAQQGVRPYGERDIINVEEEKPFERVIEDAVGVHLRQPPPSPTER